MESQTNSRIAEKEKRKHKKYRLSIDISALHESEGTIFSSFLDLAKAVILIDGVEYNEKHLALSAGRRNDFLRIIKHHAIVECQGKRKYYIKRVHTKAEKRELRKMEIEALRDEMKR